MRNDGIQADDPMAGPALSEVADEDDSMAVEDDSSESSQPTTHKRRKHRNRRRVMESRDKVRKQFSSTLRGGLSKLICFPPEMALDMDGEPFYRGAFPIDKGKILQEDDAVSEPAWFCHPHYPHPDYTTAQTPRLQHSAAVMTNVAREYVMGQICMHIARAQQQAKAPAADLTSSPHEVVPPLYDPESDDYNRGLNYQAFMQNWGTTGEEIGEPESEEVATDGIRLPQAQRMSMLSKIAPYMPRAWGNSHLPYNIDPQSLHLTLTE
jgi:hypothetical protein